MPAFADDETRATDRPDRRRTGHTLTLPVRQWDLLKRLAAERDLSISALVSEAVREHFEKQADVGSNR